MSSKKQPKLSAAIQQTVSAIVALVTTIIDGDRERESYQDGIVRAFFGGARDSHVTRDTLKEFAHTVSVEASAETVRDADAAIVARYETHQNLNAEAKLAQTGMPHDAPVVELFRRVRVTQKTVSQAKRLYGAYLAGDRMVSQWLADEQSPMTINAMLATLSAAPKAGADAGNKADADTEDTDPLATLDMQLATATRGAINAGASSSDVLARVLAFAAKLDSHLPPRLIHLVEHKSGRKVA